MGCDSNKQLDLNGGDPDHNVDPGICFISIISGQGQLIRVLLITQEVVDKFVGFFCKNLEVTTGCHTSNKLLDSNPDHDLMIWIQERLTEYLPLRTGATVRI